MLLNILLREKFATKSWKIKREDAVDYGLSFLIGLPLCHFLYRAWPPQPQETLAYHLRHLSSFAVHSRYLLNVAEMRIVHFQSARGQSLWSVPIDEIHEDDLRELKRLLPDL